MTKPKVKYYFWDWDKYHGWRGRNNVGGYDTKKACKEDNEIGIKGTYKGRISGGKCEKWIITKAIIIEEKT